MALLSASIHNATPGAFLFSGRGLDIYDPKSIRSAASTVAYGTMSYYTGNITNTPDTIGIFPRPHYWWQAGACWGAMLDYSHYTRDYSYDKVITQALLSQVGPNFDFMSPRYASEEGNDDQAFWAFSILEAAERNFPQPDGSIPSWLQIAENIWNTMVARWDDTTCNGGLRWQIYPNNPNGLDYKNSAEKVWDWSWDVGLIDQDFNVFDGASSSKECRDVSPFRFSYTQGIYLYGAAMLFNYTNGDTIWGDRTDGLLQASRAFFGPFRNSTDIMYEPACETVNRCNTDMKSFKGYLARFMAATTQMMASTLQEVRELLDASAIAAWRSCSGGKTGTECGEKWYIGGYDGNPGLGQQMTALEVIQSLLAFTARPPFRAGEIENVRSRDDTPPVDDTPASSTHPTDDIPSVSTTTAAASAYSTHSTPPLEGIPPSNSISSTSSTHSSSSTRSIISTHSTTSAHALGDTPSSSNTPSSSTTSPPRSTSRPEDMPVVDNTPTVVPQQPESVARSSLICLILASLVSFFSVLLLS